MEIRALQTKDITETVELWYEVSLKAHDFIPDEYWMKNKKCMAEIYLPNSETYLAVEDGQILGFISMAEDYLAAIFVRMDKQGHGIGKMLLKKVKKEKDSIRLKVFKKNRKSVQFYINQGFKTLSEEIDENTDETELLMEWRTSN